MSAAFDYIIVGAGSAGCTLANRLSADGTTRVLLLEAGGWDRHPLLKLPLGWGKVLLDRMYDWGDYNGATQDGFSRMQMTIRKGNRESAATAYLHPVLARGNLTVRTDSLVTRIVLEGTRAVGVEYVHNDERQFIPAAREVILCGGAINSPQVLMLSGIGDPAELAAHDIATAAPLPGVGKNLQDHVAALLIYRRRDESPLLRNMRA